MSEVECQGPLYLSLFPSSPITLTMLSSFSSAMIGPVIVFDQSEGMQVPVVPNVKLKQGAFCIVNPDFWGAEDHRVFNRTMNYTEVRGCVF